MVPGNKSIVDKPCEGVSIFMPTGQADEISTGHDFLFRILHGKVTSFWSLMPFSGSSEISPWRIWKPTETGQTKYCSILTSSVFCRKYKVHYAYRNLAKVLESLVLFPFEDCFVHWLGSLDCSKTYESSIVVFHAMLHLQAECFSDLVLYGAVGLGCTERFSFVTTKRLGIYSTPHDLP